MPRNSDNRRRAFADVVTIDAWHDGFEGMQSKADLHADVVFGTGRVGGEKISPIRFRLSVKQAEIVVVVPDSEPVDVDIKSVSRDAPEPHGQIKEVFERSTRKDGQAGVSATLSPSGLNASGTAKVSAQGASSASKTIEMSTSIDSMMVTNSKTEEGYYRWTIKPSAGKFLQGRPWDAEKNPRLRIVDKRKDPAKSIPPSVRVEVRCRREDLLVEDLQIKDDGIWEAAKKRLGFNNRMAAAISYIQNRLTEEGLEVGNIEDDFGHLTLASVTAQST